MLCVIFDISGKEFPLLFEDVYEIFQVEAWCSM